MVDLLQTLTMSPFSFSDTAESCSAGASSEAYGVRRNPLNGWVYIKINEAATCNGTVYGWSYCLDPVDDRQAQEINIAMYRVQPNGTYRLVDGSYYELKLDDAFSCGNISLQLSERFTVQQGDVVGFCEESDTVWYYEKPGSSLLRWDASGCSESLLFSSGILSEHQDRALPLLALIGM